MKGGWRRRRRSVSHTRAAPRSPSPPRNPQTPLLNNPLSPAAQELGSEKAVREGGKYRQQGKEYVVQHLDILLFKFNVRVYV